MNVFQFACKFNKTCYIFIVIVMNFKIVSSELMCEKYFEKDGSELLTIAKYGLPKRKYTWNQSVPCPCSITQPCLRKCCLKNDIFVLSKKKCNPTKNLIENQNQSIEKFLRNATYNYTLIYGSYTPTVDVSTDKIKILDDYSIQLEDRHISLDNYCFDYFREEKDYRLLELIEQQPDKNKPVPKIFTIFFLLSIFCLIITFTAYFCIDKLRNLPGKLLLCYISSLILTESCLVVLQIFIPETGLICKVIAYLFQFSFAATFFWLNVMCFDLWLAFRKHRQTRADRNNRKFFLYSLYAWGVPSVITIVIFLDDQSIIPGVKPEIGSDVCWLKGEKAIFWYFYSYYTILVLVNLYMFLTTLGHHFKNEKIRKIFKKDGNKRHNEQEKERYFLYLKLFLIMGINWIMEILSYYMQDFENMEWIWFSIDITTTLQGVLVLYIFVCNKRVLILLNEKLCPGQKFFEKKELVRNNSCGTTTVAFNHKANTQTSLDMKQGTPDQSLQSK